MRRVRSARLTGSRAQILLSFKPVGKVERLLKASLLMAPYTVRSERLLCEQLDYNFLFRWFLDLEADEASIDHSTFSRNRTRLLEHVLIRARKIHSALHCACRKPHSV